MAKSGELEVTKHFPDGHTEVEIVESCSGDGGKDGQWFTVDKKPYFWPRRTQRGEEVEYKPSRMPYKRLIAKLPIIKKETVGAINGNANTCSDASN